MLVSYVMLREGLRFDCAKDEYLPMMTKTPVPITAPIEERRGLGLETCCLGSWKYVIVCVFCGCLIEYQNEEEKARNPLTVTFFNPTIVLRPKKQKRKYPNVRNVQWGVVPGYPMPSTEHKRRKKIKKRGGPSAVNETVSFL